MRILVLGCGNIGSVVAEDIGQSLSSAQIVIADMNEDLVKEVASRIGRENVSWTRVDASNHNELVKTLGKFGEIADSFMTAPFSAKLPWRIVIPPLSEKGLDIGRITSLFKVPLPFNLSKSFPSTVSVLCRSFFFSSSSMTAETPPA